VLAFRAALLVAALLVVPAPAGAEPPDCEERVPAAYTPPTEPTRNVTLSTLVVLDGAGVADARRTTDEVARVYAPLGVTVRATYRQARLAGDAPQPDGTPAGRPDQLLPQLKKAVRASRPKGTDVVFLLTDKRLFTWPHDLDGDGTPDEGERRYGVAGVAECIGGVRWPDKSFALSVGPYSDLWNVRDAALTMAHEIGHLLGAHHEYAECASGTSDGPRDGVVRACTVMFNATYGRGPVHTMSDRWSALEAAVIRGHATEYAAP
jgi:hypothetical protein